MKDHKESKEEESPELLGEWIDQLKAVDKTLRERLFIMTIAAEEGWRVASEVAFSKKGIEENIGSLKRKISKEGNI